MKFTFKHGPRPTGLAAVGDPYPQTDIKFDGKICGRILFSRQSRDWGIAVMVKITPTALDPAPFKNLAFETRFPSLADAKQYLLYKMDEILELNLHFLDD